MLLPTHGAVFLFTEFYLGIGEANEYPSELVVVIALFVLVVPSRLLIAISPGKTTQEVIKLAPIRPSLCMTFVS